MEDKKYTKDNLNALGIFQLRDLARNVGVHLPTTYKKDELIEKILQVMSGEILPFVPKNKKGRPPKILVDYGGDVGFQNKPAKKTNKFSWILGELMPENSGVSFVEEFKVCMPDAVFYSKDENKPQKTSGVVFVEPSGAGALHVGGLSQIMNSDMAYISSDIIKAYNIKTGDEITCNVYVNLDNEKVVSEIEKINDFDIKLFERKYDSEKNFDVLASCKKIDFDELKELNTNVLIGKGQRVFVKSDKSLTCTKFLSKVSLSGNKNNQKTIVVSVDKRPEEKSLYDEKNIEYIFCNFDVTPFRQTYLINLGVERAKRLCEMGYDVMLLIDNMVSALRAYDCYFDKNEQDACGYGMQAQIAIKKLLAVGGNVKNGGSITLFAGIYETDQEANKFFDRVESFCNSHIYLETNQNGDFVINDKSYTENAKEIIT